MSCYYHPSDNECYLLLKYDPEIGWVVLITSGTERSKIVVMSTLGWGTLSRRGDIMVVSNE